MASHLKSRRRGSSRPGCSPGRRQQTRRIPRRTGQWSLSLGMGQEVSGAIPGNSQLGLLVLPIPQRVARRS